MVDQDIDFAGPRKICRILELTIPPSKLVQFTVEHAPIPVPGKTWAKVLVDVVKGVAKSGPSILEQITQNCDYMSLTELETKFQKGIYQVLTDLDKNYNAIKINLNALKELKKEMNEGFKKMGNQLDKILFEVYQNYYEIMDVNQNVDRNYAAIRKNLHISDRNFDAIIDDASKKDRILEIIAERFYAVYRTPDQPSDKEFEWFEKLEKLTRRRRIQDKTSELASVLKEFTEIREHLKHRRISKLTGEKGYYRFLKHGKTLKSAGRLYTLLNEILNEEMAVPKNATDDEAFTALHLVLLGTKTYIAMFQFVIIGNGLAITENYKRSDVEKYNQSRMRSVAEFHAFQSLLCGIGSQAGLISDVIRVLIKIQKLHFITDQSSLAVSIAQNITYFRDIKKRIADIIYSDDDQPTNRIRTETNNAKINTPFLDWQDARRVRYAVQYELDGMFSLISDWSVPFTIDGKASLELDIGEAPPGTTRVIFRQFDYDKPKLVGIVDNPTQDKFQDLDRDLYDAVLEGNQELARINADFLIKRGASFTAKFENGREVIHAATKAGNIDVVRDLLKRGVDVNAGDDAGYTSLHIAAESGDEELVQELIRLGADVRASKHFKWTALHVAATHGHVKTLKVLEEADLNAKAAGGFTPLHMAVNSRRKRSAELLISNKRTDVNAQSHKLLTPLHLAVLGLDGKAVGMLLSNSKCDANIRAHGGLSTLHLAVISGDENIVEQLVQNNATNINAKSDEGWSSLHFAILFKKRSVFEKLLQSTGINVNLEGKDKITPLQLAYRIGEEAIILDLIKNGAQVQSAGISSPPSHNASGKVHFLDEKQETLRPHASGKHLPNARSNSTTFHFDYLNGYIKAHVNTSAQFQNSGRVSLRENTSFLAHGGQGDTALPSDQLGYSPSMVNNIFLVKWLFYMFGRRSLIKRVTKVESLVENLRVDDSHLAETLLHQGMARYGRLKS